MNINNRRCGECGQKTLALVNVKNNFVAIWREYPQVFITVNLELAECQNCGNHIVISAKQYDQAIENSLRDQVAQFIDITKGKTGLKSHELAKIIGITPTYLSSLHSKTKTPSFQVWNILKAIAIDPVEMCKKLDPKYNVVKENILLHA